MEIEIGLMLLFWVFLYSWNCSFQAREPITFTDKENKWAATERKLSYESDILLGRLLGWRESI